VTVTRTKVVVRKGGKLLFLIDGMCSAVPINDGRAWGGQAGCTCTVLGVRGVGWAGSMG
jgi:hypothetical protein